MNRIAPNYLKRTLSGFPQGLVVVSGSAGKSTTTKMLVAILREHGVDVFTNPSTANISQGLTSALLEQADWRGRVPGEVAVLEMDEGHGALVMQGVDARVVCLTNVMVDQIDRFHDSEMVAGMLGRIAARAGESVVVNADDAYLERLAEKVGPDVSVRRFGVSQSVLDAAPRGLGYTETSTTRLDPAAGVVIDSVEGRTTTLLDEGRRVVAGLPARGTHYAVDAAAAYSTAKAVLGERFSGETAARALDAIPAVFGRGERVTVRGQEVEFVLVQNPASYQLNVDSIEPGTSDILFAIGSDVRDPSYFWPADASSLRRVAIVSGSKAAEAALMLAYDGVGIDRIEPDLARALDDFLAAPAPTAGVKTIVFSADSMRRTRAHLGLTGTE
ncbi:MurT ligase domain-containing protein [Agromyces sp. H3Y2-19a]|uniref:Mur ligase family protein n=1 Tax=Agromyces TaxID=33877 RepID=UPI001E51B263|nr:MULTISPECIES: MurT ligase domain-containing protein [Agromyces]MCD5347228.1 MurT ligase domain-containing protein [Agromyces sp. S2-1-8]MDF0513272.1 MurT ligase domain-containing protein [Agromyces chromiiresistens]